MNISVVILAAGQSLRMGRVKALLPLPLGPSGADCSALEGLARLFRGQGLTDIVVVSGYHAEAVEAEARRLDLATVRNPAPERGMFSSVCTGLSAFANRAAQGDTEALVVTPVDVPLLRPLTLMTLQAEAEKDRARSGDCAPVLIPLFSGREGHPPLIPEAYIRRILAHNGREGLRGALATLPRRVLSVADAMILEDMDRPEDYKRLQRLAPERGVLSPEEAWVLLRQRDVLPKILRHSEAVGQVAARFAERLVARREAVGRPAACDPRLAQAGGLLHDICKGQPRHERAGGELLDSLGLPRMARIVRDHLDLELPEDMPLSERELVCLADKYCAGDRLVPLERRYEEKMRHFADDKAVQAAILGRMARAQKLAERVARECACAPFAMAREVLTPAREPDRRA